MNNKTIWKYPLIFSAVRTLISLELSKGAEVLTVQLQDDIPVLWAMVDPEAATESRGFTVIATGRPIEPTIHTFRYIATYQQSFGFVGHVFEVI